MSQENPYESPQSPPEISATSIVNPDYDGAACPHCGASDAKVPGFTLWGGVIGHKILSHVICNACRRGFNSKTGKSNLTNIILYQVVIFVVLGGLLFMAGLFAWLS